METNFNLGSLKIVYNPLMEYFKKIQEKVVKNISVINSKENLEDSLDYNDLELFIQVQSSLKMIGLNGLVQVLDLNQEAFEYTRGVSVDDKLNIFNKINQCLVKVDFYMQNLIDGSMDEPTKLFEVYKDLASSIGKNVVISDLFFPKLDLVRNNSVSVLNKELRVGKIVTAENKESLLEELNTYKVIVEKSITTICETLDKNEEFSSIEERNEFHNDCRIVYNTLSTIQAHKLSKPYYILFALQKVIVSLATPINNEDFKDILNDHKIELIDNLKNINNSLEVLINDINKMRLGDKTGSLKPFEKMVKETMLFLINITNNYSTLKEMPVFKELNNIFNFNFYAKQLEGASLKVTLKQDNPGLLENLETVLIQLKEEVIILTGKNLAENMFETHMKKVIELSSTFKNLVEQETVVLDFLNKFISFSEEVKNKNIEYTDDIKRELSLSVVFLELSVQEILNKEEPNDYLKSELELISQRLDNIINNVSNEDLPLPSLDAITKKDEEEKVLLTIFKEISKELNRNEESLDAIIRTKDVDEEELDLVLKSLKNTSGIFTMLRNKNLSILIENILSIWINIKDNGFDTITDELNNAISWLSGLSLYVEAYQEGNVVEAEEIEFKILTQLKSAMGDKVTLVEVSKEELLDEPVKYMAETTVSERKITEMVSAPEEPSVVVIDEAPEPIHLEGEELEEATQVEEDIKEANENSTSIESVEEHQEQVKETSHDIVNNQEDNNNSNDLEDGFVIDKVNPEDETTEFFFLEMIEVKETLFAALESLRKDNSDIESLTTIRRSFHTIKGSGKMVGFMNLGDIAWIVEDKLNRVLATKEPVSVGVLDAIEYIANKVFDWSNELETNGQVTFNVDIEKEEFNRLSTADIIDSEDSHNTELVDDNANENVEVFSSVVQEPVIEEVQNIEPLAEETITNIVHDENTHEEENKDKELSLIIDDTPKSEINIEEFMEELNKNSIFTENVEPSVEKEQEIESVNKSDDTEASDNTELVDDNTNDDSSPELVQEPVVEDPPAYEIPSVTQMPIETGNVFDGSIVDDTEVDEEDNKEDFVTIFGKEIALDIYTSFKEEFLEKVNALKSYVVNINSINSVISDDFMRNAHTIASIAKSVNLNGLSNVAKGLEDLSILSEELQKGFTRVEIRSLKYVVDSLVDFSNIENENTETSDLYLDVIDVILDLKDILENKEEDAASYKEILDALNEVKKSMVDFKEEQAISNKELALKVGRNRKDMKTLYEIVKKKPTENDNGDSPNEVANAEEDWAGFGDGISSKSEKIALFLEENPNLKMLFEEKVSTMENEIDQELFDISKEEIDSKFASIDVILEKITSNSIESEDISTLKRDIHTLKGSVRMYGNNKMGLIAHRLESLLDFVENHNINLKDVYEILELELDKLKFLNDNIDINLTSNQAIWLDNISSDSLLDEDILNIANKTVEENESKFNIQYLKVMSKALDNLINEAGEIRLSRTTLEGTIESNKKLVNDLRNSSLKIQSIVKELELKAEVQIASKESSVTDNEHFDPLEFDRYNRLQELTRFLNEATEDVKDSVNSIEHVHKIQENSIIQQSFLTDSILDSLMDVRLVSVDSVADKFYKIVRLTAKDADKLALLRLSGEKHEVDRIVLEKIQHPIEHLLRNSLIHGIEMPEERERLGKSPQGLIKIDISVDGSFIIFNIEDDGAGINIDRIKTKALEKGLIEEDIEYSNEELLDLIFKPGFTTATLTQNAGRGIGMDVVRSEVLSLGGSIKVFTEEGKGSQFVIALPLSVATNQAMLTTVEDKLFAIPAMFIEEVISVKDDELKAGYNNGIISLRKVDYPLYYLGHLSGVVSKDILPNISNYNTLIVISYMGQKIILHVDTLKTIEEVVIKSAGKTLSKINGLLGLTLLGDGKQGLVINPVLLVEHFNKFMKGKDDKTNVKNSKNKNGKLNKKLMALVVDDSIVIRKVTSKFLEKSNFNVVLAKDGEDALKKLQDNTPDIILSDIEMPVMNGFELVKHIRNTAKFKNIPIIMITSRTADKHKEYAFSLGANDFLGKPYQEEELIKTINKLLES